MAIAASVVPLRRCLMGVLYDRVRPSLHCSPDDPFFCPFDPITNSEVARSISFNISCNLSMPLGQGAPLVL